MITCTACRQPIQGRYLKHGKKSYHPDCFICRGCGEVIGSGSFMEQRGKPYHPACYHERFSPRCASCGEILEGGYVTAMGRDWHPDHFTCVVCGKPFGQEAYIEKDGSPYHGACYAGKFAPHCAGCGEPITGKLINALGQSWHERHFTCTSCGKPFNGKSFHVQDGKPYCRKDFFDLFGKRCAVCGKPIMGRYLTDGWGNEFCASHESDSTCSSCGRVISKELTGAGVRYQDGRQVCGLCRETAVDSIKEAREVYQEVGRFLSGAGLRLELSSIPLALAGEKEIKPKGKRKRLSGLTKTRINTLNGKETSREVEEILALYGLPRTRLGAVLAHEMTHAWLFLERYPQLPEKLEEGLCELTSALWLETQKGVEAEFLLRTMAENKDRVYGVGFRAARRALKKHTLPDLLRYVKKHQSLP